MTPPVVCCATEQDRETALDAITSRISLPVNSLDLCARGGGDVVMKYHSMYKEWRNDTDTLVYVHDDVTIHEPWVERVQAEFEDPSVAIVGLGGAVGIGVDDIYKTRYDITQLQRIGYHSSQTDAEVHGQRFAGSMDVAVVDGFFMAVRTAFLDRIGGWKWMHPEVKFHMYDIATCCRALELGYKVRMAGVSCTHHGGGTSTKESYKTWCLNNNTSIEEEHLRPHRWFYSRFRNLLPYRVH